MAVKANWFAQAAADDMDDPFAAQASLPICSESSSDELFSRLQKLGKREAQLDRMGITCPLKDLPNGSCSACPICKADDPDQTISSLCRVGQEQERIEMMMLARTYKV